MNTFINYMIEANFGLCIFIILYFLILKSETDFRISRLLMLGGIAASVLFPIIHMDVFHNSVPMLNTLIPSYFLTEIIIGYNGSKTFINNEQNFWSILTLIYASGVFFLLSVFAIRIFKLIRLVRSSTTYSSNNLIIAESVESKLTFSFFHFVFIGQSNPVSDKEKTQILNHERIHAEQWHSIDVLLLHLLKIVFWFNPIVYLYKKIFVQLHEFEADSRAVENNEVNEYCSLLARVALQSADFTIANHFNQSLTLKRIAMMQTIKTKIKMWKAAAILLVFPVLFLVIACQDQLTSDLTTVANSAAVSLDLPPEVQTKVNELKAAHPGKEFVVIESTTEEGKLKAENMNVSQIESVNVFKSGDRAFIIIEQNAQTVEFAGKASTDMIYTIVENMPEYTGGQDAMINHISSNMLYPESAMKAGIQGTTFTSFIVNKNGTISDVEVLKGISPECDAEAIRVIKSMPDWKPGTQKGQPVNVRFVLPIKFSLG